MNTEKPTLEDLNNALEKMYHEHNAQMTNLSRMIVVLARISGKTPEEFAKEINADEQNKIFASTYNTFLDIQRKSTEE